VGVSGSSVFSLNVSNLRSDALRSICRVLAKAEKSVPYFLTLNGEATWPYHRFLIEVDSNSAPTAFPLHFHPPICSTIHETSIYDDKYKERLDIAAKSSVEVRVKGQVRNGSNRIQFCQGQARVDEIGKVQVWELDGEAVLGIFAYIDPYRASRMQVTKARITG
jgi:hypothetical protein